MEDPPSRARRIVWGVGAFVSIDLITGMACFSVISLIGLWLFSITWIRVAAEAAQRGISFYTPGQLDLAWVGAVSALPLAGLTVYLGIRAYGVSRDLMATGGRESLRQLRGFFPDAARGPLGPAR